MRDARDRARPHAHHNVSGGDNLGQRRGQRIIFGQGLGMAVPMRAQALDEMLGVKTLNRLFSGGENRQDKTTSAAFMQLQKSAKRSRRRV